MGEWFCEGRAGEEEEQVRTGRRGMLVEERELVRSDETYERRALSTTVSPIAMSARTR